MNKQVMPTGQKGVGIIWIVIIVVILIGLFVFFYLEKNPVNKAANSQIPMQTPAPSQSPSMLTYINSKYGYSIQYPSSLAVREFPDTGTGAGFRPADKPEDPRYEVITINALEKNAALADDPLSDYATAAAIIQIQGYQKLNSIIPVTTNSGLTGYETTWMISGPPVLGATYSGQLTQSLPITYFDLPKANMPSTAQIYLSDQNYIAIYQNMIKTFSLLAD